MLITRGRLLGDGAAAAAEEGGGAAAAGGGGGGVEEGRIRLLLLLRRCCCPRRRCVRRRFAFAAAAAACCAPACCCRGKRRKGGGGEGPPLPSRSAPAPPRFPQEALHGSKRGGGLGGLRGRRLPLLLLLLLLLWLAFCFWLALLLLLLLPDGGEERRGCARGPDGGRGRPGFLLRGAGMLQLLQQLLLPLLLLARLRLRGRPREEPREALERGVSRRRRLPLPLPPLLLLRSPPRRLLGAAVAPRPSRGRPKTAAREGASTLPSSRAAAAAIDAADVAEGFAPAPAGAGAVARLVDRHRRRGRRGGLDGCSGCGADRGGEVSRGEGGARRRGCYGIFLVVEEVFFPEEVKKEKRGRERVGDRREFSFRCRLPLAGREKKNASIRTWSCCCCCCRWCCCRGACSTSFILRRDKLEERVIRAGEREKRRRER